MAFQGSGIDIRAWLDDENSRAYACSTTISGHSQWLRFLHGQNQNGDGSGITAVPHDEHFVADLGQGIEVIWTPAADPDELGIPALEGAPQLPSVWVYPPTEQPNKILANPVHPPDCQDAIIWFPATDIPAIDVVLVRNEPGVVTG